MSALPYVFDLLWDIKDKDALESSILSSLKTVASQLESIEDTGVVLSTATTTRIKLTMDMIHSFVRS